MKHQYFGDINDYRKYGLLRLFLLAGVSDLRVAWMLTPPDGRNDGNIRSYLQKPTVWRRYDAELFDHLAHLVSGETALDLTTVATRPVLPGAKFFWDAVPDDRDARALWGDALRRACRGAELVFVDPDNGLEVDSCPVGRPNSRKYLLWSELASLTRRGSSVLVYQHFQRENRDAFIARLFERIHTCTGLRDLHAFRTGNVVFFLAAQPAHWTQFGNAVVTSVRMWADQITHTPMAG